MIRISKPIILYKIRNNISLIINDSFLYNQDNCSAHKITMNYAKESILYINISTSSRVREF